MTAPKPRVLSIDVDAVVLDSRSRVLQTAGFEVVTCLGGENAAEIFAAESIDVVVVGDSLFQVTGKSPIGRFREAKPAVPIVIVCQPGEPCAEALFADITVESMDGPERLIQTVSSLLQKSARSEWVTESLKQRAG